MKTLKDGKQVSSKSYYFLLDWNEKNNWEFIIKEFNKNRLCDLNIEEYKKLWLHATNCEYNSFN